MKHFIYADNAATTKMDLDALAVMCQYLIDDFGNASQPYSFSKKTKRALKQARKSIAAYIGADPEEIFFTSGGSESDNWAIKSLKTSTNRSVIVTSQIEHHAILNACKGLDLDNNQVRYLPVNSFGIVNIETLKQNLSANTKLVSVMLANNEIGTIEPIKALAAEAHACGAYFHTDAVQAVGHIPVNVKSLNVDLLSASAHKFNGPKGIGFLYVKKGTPITPFIDGGGQEFGYRAGTENVPAIVAMSIALHRNCEQMSNNIKHLLTVEDAFIQALRNYKIDFIRNGAKDHIPGNVSISIHNASGEMLLHRLDLKGIMVSTGSACDSVNTQISHVIKAIGVPKEYAMGTVRISFGRENTVEEAELIAAAIAQIVS